MSEWGTLSTLSTPDLLRYVDRSHPEVAELAGRLELFQRTLDLDLHTAPYDLVQQLREVAGL